MSAILTGLHSIYMADLADVANEHSVTMHSFADDTQLYFVL